MERRDFLAICGSLAFSACINESPSTEKYKLNYILASCLYGYMPLKDILPEVKKTGASAIDIWCKVHGNQREQVKEMGDAAFANLLAQNTVRFGGFTQYPLGPFGLQKEMANVKKFGGSYVLCAGPGSIELVGLEAETAVKAFLEKMKPHIVVAENLGIDICLENHSKTLLYHPDSIKAFADHNKSTRLKVAFAPHHLYRWVSEIPELITSLNDQIGFFYAQEHGKGSYTKMPKVDEMLQMPGFGGGLDYKPIVGALKKINYQGYVEIFMHPFPRGLPILPTIPEITAAINKSRAYLDGCLGEV
jgi:sugar phosphate isomerase/epimerase